jgi:hypothetical protein
MECDYKCMNIPRIVPGGLDGGGIWGLGENKHSHSSAGCMNGGEINSGL